MDERQLLGRVSLKAPNHLAKLVHALYFNQSQARKLDAQMAYFVQTTLDDALISDNISPSLHSSSSLRFCEETEGKFIAVLDPKANRTKIKRGYGDYSQFGVIFTIQDHPFGVLKYRGEDTFLCTRSVVDSEGNPVLLKYGLYEAQTRHNKQFMPKPFTWRSYEQKHEGTFIFRRFFNPANVFKYYRYNGNKILPLLNSVSSYSIN